MKLRVIVAVAAIVVKSRNSGEKFDWNVVETISKTVFELQERLPMEECAMRRVPDGFYSEDVDRLLGTWLMCGYCQWSAERDMEFTEDGIRLLEEILLEELVRNPQVAQELFAEMGLDAQVLLANYVLSVNSTTRKAERELKSKVAPLVR